MIKNEKDPKIIVALDFVLQKEMINFLEKIDPNLCRVKIGLRLFIKYGPKVVEKVMKMGYSVFLDLKMHDIPSQVKASCKLVADLGVWMTTVHALGGVAMCTAASEAVSQYRNPPKMIGVTVLTSTDQKEISRMGINTDIESLLTKLGGVSEKSGLSGVVCSGLDIEYLKKNLKKDLIFVTPGIRISAGGNFNSQDQKRILTPKEAIEFGSNYLVIGRPILEAKDPENTIREIYKSFEETELMKR